MMEANTFPRRNKTGILPVAAVIALSAGWAWGLNDGLALTPPMGWNSYNYYKLNVKESDVKATADAFVSSGLKDAGYRYIVIDDMWATAARTSAGDFTVNSQKFPGGMKALADYIHDKGLKFGIYSNPTTRSCGGQVGSYQHEAQDAKLFASWGVDYLKYDWCGSQSGENGKFTDAQIVARYVSMREAIKTAGRPMIYAICDKGQGVTKLNISVWSDTVGHMWRIGNDIAATWDRIWAQVDNNAGRAQYAHPGGWNDPDMMEVGNGSFTEAENRAHFSLWCIMASPIMLGNNVTSMTTAVKNILTNMEAIAVNQDSLGKQGAKVKTSGQVEVWAKDLKNGDKAVLFVNRGTGSGSASIQWTDTFLKWTAAAKVNIRDVWKKTDTRDVTSGVTATVPGHDAVLYRLTNGVPTAIRDAAGDEAGFSVIGRAGAMSLYLPRGQTGMAEVTDMGGRRLARFPVEQGSNPIPAALAAERLYVVRLAASHGTYVRRIFPVR